MPGIFFNISLFIWSFISDVLIVYSRFNWNDSFLFILSIRVFSLLCFFSFHCSFVHECFFCDNTYFFWQFLFGTCCTHTCNSTSSIYYLLPPHLRLFNELLPIKIRHCSVYICLAYFCTEEVHWTNYNICNVSSQYVSI